MLPFARYVIYSNLYVFHAGPTSCLCRYAICVLSISLFCVISLCNGLAFERGLNVTNPSFYNNTQTINCGFTGNSDVLRVGIRIGYYTQALSVWFANYFILSEANALRSINLLFLVALFIGLVWLSHRPEGTHAIGVFLLLRLLFATWYVGVLDRSKFSKKYWRKIYMWVIIRECSLLGLLSYAVWFAWIGFDHVEKTPCGTFVFFIVKVSLYGWYRSAFKVLSFSTLCFGAVKQVDTALQIYQRQQSNAVRSPDYFSRLQQSLLDCNAKDYGSTDSDRSNASRSSTSQPPISSLNVLEVAAQTPLPQSPPQPTTSSPNPSQTVDSQYNSSLANDPSNSKFPSLEDLIAADHYLQDIINVNVSNHSSWCNEIRWLSLKVFLPSMHSPWSIYKRISSLLTCRPFHLPILMPLFRHIKSMCRYPLYSYFIMIETTLHHPYHKQTSPMTLLTTLAFHKARLPPRRPKPNVLFHASASLGMCFMLILGIELSIRWNSITELGNIGAVGQLIPAIVGIGGLIRTIWIWRSRGDTSEDEEDGVGRELRDCVGVSEKLKKRGRVLGRLWGQRRCSTQKAISF